MQSDSSSLDTLKDNLLRAVDAEYNVTKCEVVLDIICQLEKMEITKDQLQSTRLGREINTIRQKIDARKKNLQQIDKYADIYIEIAQRAKKLLRSWQGLLNTSQTDSTSITSTPPTNGDTKPRLILKVKFNSPITKRKRDLDSHTINGTNNKRKKTHIIETSVPLQTPISPVILTETNSSLPRLKTTQQLLLEMQMNEPSVLATQTSTVDAILQKKIIDESLHETVKLDYSALHNGKDFNNTNINSTHFQKQLSSITSPSNNNHIPGSSSKRKPLIRRPSSSLITSNTNWENGSSAGSPISPLSSTSSSSSMTSTTSWPLSTIIPEPTLTIPILSKSKRQKKHDDLSTNEQLVTFSSDIATICASYNTITDLMEDHRRRILAEHDSRELEARPDLLLVPIDQLAFVYEREKTKELNLPIQSTHSSITSIEKLNQPSDCIALPFIDCPFEFDLILDELVVQHPILDM
ncbi:unnamed protein product [Adineta steineri]|uniref:TFIIS N-terminal domain-containing protein n=1 Tax=Adineta steineri TaxID=433720 RepID=A0A813NPY1_9BILA|nr:unnamed protein product [Adineta steineri]